MVKAVAGIEDWYVEINLNDNTWRYLNTEVRKANMKANSLHSLYTENKLWHQWFPYRRPVSTDNVIYKYLYSLLYNINEIDVATEHDYVRVNLPLDAVMPTTPFINECLAHWDGPWRVSDRCHEIDECYYILRLADMADMATPKRNHYPPYGGS